MDGFTVKNADRFLESGRLDFKDTSRSSISSTSGTSESGNATDIQKSFSQTLSDAIGSVNELQKKSDKGIQDLATGRTDNISEVMVTAEKADIALKLMVQVRNKIIDAYSEIMRMQV